MPRESVHKKLTRVRKPRVHITYDVEVGDAIEKKELPFVVGVLADLSGKPKEALPRIKDRKFVEIDRDNFDQVLAGMKPRLTFKAPNRLANDDSQLGIELEFKNLDDFGPEAVAQQVEPIRKLVEARQRLNELAVKLNSSDQLDELLQDVVQNTEALKELSGASRRGAGRREGGGQEEWLTTKRRPHRGSAEVKTEEVNLLDQILDNVSSSADPDQRGTPRRTSSPTSRSRCWTARSSIGKDTESMIKARIAQLDRLISAQLNEVMHAPEFQKLEASWRGLHYLVHADRDQHDAEDQGLQHARRRTCSRTSSAPPSSIRARCSRRSTRRSTACSAARRSGCSSATTSSATTRRTWRCSRRCRTSPRRRTRRSSPRRRRQAVRPRELHRARRAARPGEDLRLGRVREVEVVPRVRRLAVRRAVPAARADAAAVRQRDRPGRGVQLRGGRRRPRPQASTCGATRPTRSPRGSPMRSRSTAGAPRFAASRAAAWSRACRRTPSGPTRATSR